MIPNLDQALMPRAHPLTVGWFGTTAWPDCVRVSFIDTGVGIPPEHLTRIFAHGFTTQVDSHGFGLHSGVLAACEMGRSLTFHSDSPATGANFTLKLPATYSTCVGNAMGGGRG